MPSSPVLALAHATNRDWQRPFRSARLTGCCRPRPAGRGCYPISMVRTSCASGEWPLFAEQIDVITASTRPGADVATPKNRVVRTPAHSSDTGRLALLDVRLLIGLCRHWPNARNRVSICRLAAVRPSEATNGSFANSMRRSATTSLHLGDQRLHLRSHQLR